MRGMLRQSGAKRSQLLLVIAAAGLAAGCSNTSSRLATAQLFAASNNPSATSTVDARPLAPLTGPGATASAYASPGTVNTTSLSARGWSVKNAPIVEVTSADTAVTLSQGYGVPVDVILEANGLSSASEITAGRRLVIPTYVRRDTPAQSVPTTSAPVVVTGPGAPPTTLNAQAGIPPVTETVRVDERLVAVPEGGHTVVLGETLWSISERYGVPPHDVIAINNLPANGTVRVGQTLKLPGSSTAQQPVKVASADPTVVDTTRLAGTVAPALAPKPETAAAPVETAALTPPAADVVDDGGAGFRWPVRGRLIAGFGKQADGARNDGINLAVPAGTPVRAAKTGTVIYAGNELEGYGNLILVQHDDDWVSAYAHNETLKVNRGDTVQRGQTIAAAGATGSVDQPQLHFELRKRSKPVDPLPHLGGA